MDQTIKLNITGSIGSDLIDTNRFSVIQISEDSNLNGKLTRPGYITVGQIKTGKAKVRVDEGVTLLHLTCLSGLCAEEPPYPVSWSIVAATSTPTPIPNTDTPTPTPTFTGTPTSTPTGTTAPPTDTPTPTPTGTTAPPTDTPTPTPTGTTAPPTDTPTPTPTVTVAPATYYRFTNCVTSAFVFQTSGITSEPNQNSRWTDGVDNYTYLGVSTTLPGSPIVTNLSGPIGTDCYDAETVTPTPIPGTCQFVFVSDSVDTSNKGLQYSLGGEIKTPFPMIGTYSTYGGQNGTVYGICTTTTPQWWDVAQNTFTPLPSGVYLLASGGPCQANGGCEYQTPTPTPTPLATDTPTPTPQTTYYLFDACDGGQTIAAAIATPLDANLRYVDYSSSPVSYFTYTGNSNVGAVGYPINNNLQSTGNTQYGCLQPTTPPPTSTPTPPPGSKFSTSPSPAVSISSNGTDQSTFTLTVTETVTIKATATVQTGSGTANLTLNVTGQGSITTGNVTFSGSGSTDTTANITLSAGTYNNCTLTLVGTNAPSQFVVQGNVSEA